MIILSNIIIADAEDLLGLIIFLVVSVAVSILSKFVNSAKEKREQERFDATQAALRNKPRPAADSSDAERAGWQRVSVVQEDLASFLLKAKRNRAKLKQQKTSKRFAGYHNDQPAQTPEIEDVPLNATPHLNIAPLPSQDDELPSHHHVDLIADGYPSQPIPVPPPQPVPVPRIAHHKPKAKKKKYVFQREENHLLLDHDTGESTTHRIVANDTEVDEVYDEVDTVHRVNVNLRTAKDLRKAFVLSEIMGRPLAMREESRALWDM